MTNWDGWHIERIPLYRVFYITAHNWIIFAKCWMHFNTQCTCLNRTSRVLGYLCYIKYICISQWAWFENKQNATQKWNMFLPFSGSVSPRSGRLRVGIWLQPAKNRSIRFGKRVLSKGVGLVSGLVGSPPARHIKKSVDIMLNRQTLLN